MNSLRRYVTLQDYEMEIVRQVGYSCTAKPDQFIYRPGDVSDFVYLIENGRVKFFQGVKVSHVRYSGDLFGVTEMLQQVPRGMFACAITPLQYMAIEKASFLELLECEPFLTVKLARALSHMVDDIDARTQQVASQWVLERIAHLLLKMSEENSRRVTRPEHQLGSFLVSDLVAILSVNEQTVLTFLEAMGQLHCLEIKGQTVLIKDREMLKSLIN